MRYQGYFSLSFASDSRHFCVEFDVDEFDTPTGCLRRIARVMFEREGAIGLRLDAVETVSTTCLSGQNVAVRRERCAASEQRPLQAC